VARHSIGTSSPWGSPSSRPVTIYEIRHRIHEIWSLLDCVAGASLVEVRALTDERSCPCVDRHVDLYVQSNPSAERVEVARRLREAVDARKARARCACGAFIWAIGSADAGAACFTGITGEAWPDSDYEIDEALGLPPG
jgi:hypothetical protein